MISTLVSLPYELARMPLTVVDHTLADRLSETSTARVTLDRALGSADRIAGTLTRNRTLAARGSERLARLDKLVTAEKLEKQAERRREQAERTQFEGQVEATFKRQVAETKAKSALFEADAVETEAKRKAKLKARETAKAKKSAADDQAVRVIETAEQQEKREKAAAEARRKAAERRAKAKQDRARATEQAAEQARAEAERLEDLTEAKKQERSQG